MGMFGPPPAKSKDFRGSLRRLLAQLRPERRLFILVISLTSISVILNAFGPKILGRATNYVFYGFLGRRIPIGVSKAQALAGLRARGEMRLADMLQKSPVTPGQGVNFGAIARLLLLAILLFLFGSFFMWWQGYLIFEHGYGDGNDRGV